MLKNNPKKIIIVDDSVFFREVLSKIISEDAELTVVAKAMDPFDARDKILEYHPDLMICDVEMPKMNGVEFIKRLLPQYPLPVIVVSSVCEAVFNAMDAGAVDFICKPNPQKQEDMKLFQIELLRKIRIAFTAKIRIGSIKNNQFNTVKNNFNYNKIIAIGASTGGTEAIYQIIKNLPPNMPGILIVQHIPPIFSGMFAERLNNQTKFKVMEAENGVFVEPGKVIVAPGDQHIRIKQIDKKYRVECFTGDKVNGHCPSVDVLFDSVATHAGKNAIGVILTGMGCDGAKGLLKMRNQGARTLGQNEASSVVYGMPKVAYTIGAVEKQAALEEIPELLQILSK